jgi:hypothetical protein
MPLVVQGRGDAQEGGGTFLLKRVDHREDIGVLWRSLGCPFRKASLVRALWSLSFLVLPGIRCQNSTQIRDDDAVVRAGRYAATRVNLWMVVGLRFAVTAMDRILTLKLVDGSDGLTT